MSTPRQSAAEDTAGALRRDLRRGALVGLLAGILLALAASVAGFPEWSRTLWSFVLIAGVLLPVALAVRLLTHAVWRLTQTGIPRERHTSVPGHVLGLLSWANLAGAACVVAASVLLVAFVIGDDGRRSPF